MDGCKQQMAESRPCVCVWRWGGYLRSDVVRGPAEGACGVALEHALPAHPKVGYLYVAFAVKQNIIQLQIPEKEEDGSHRYESLW